MEQQEGIEAYFEKGKSYFAQEQYEEALPWLEKVKAAAPKDSGTNLMLGFIYGMMDRNDESIDAATIFLEVVDIEDENNRPNIIMAFRTLGMAFLQAGDIARSLQSFNLALEWDGGSVQTLTGLGEAHLKANDFVAAENVLQQAIAKEPENVRANHWMGKVYFSMQGHLKEAESSFVKVIQLDPDFADAYFQLAMCYLRRDQKLKSYEQVRHLVRLGDQDNKERLFEMFAVGAGISVKEFRHALSLGEKSQEYTTVLSRVAVFINAEERRDEEQLGSLEHVIQGREFLANEEGELAAKSFKKALDLDATNAAVHRFLGVSYSMCERYEDAAKAYGESAKLEPTNVRIFNLLGGAWMQLHDRYNEAISAFEQACAVDPQNFHARNFLGNAYYCEGTPESLAKALESHQRASKIEPDNPQPYQSMAVTYIELGEKEKALEQAEKLRPLDDEQYRQVMADINAMPDASDSDDSEAVSSELEAINFLSDEFEENVRRQERNSTTTTIQLASNDRIVGQGEKILGLYESELANAPDSYNVQMALTQHLARMGYLYAESVSRAFLHWDPYFSNFGDAECAQRACKYLLRSYGMFPTSGTASLLANIFIKAEFFATALHWYGEAEKLAQKEDNPQLALKLKAGILNLRSEGHAEDPLLSPDKKFPTRETAGLALENQPKTPSKSANSATPVTGGVQLEDESIRQKQSKLDEEKRQLQLKADVVARQKQQEVAEEKKQNPWTNFLRLCGLGVCAWIVVAGLQCMNQPRTSTAQSNAPVRVSNPNTGLLTTADLDGKTKFQLDILRNQIFARHGLKFGKSRKDLSRYFESQAWYKPNTSNTDVVWGRLSPAEKKNVTFIRDYQIQRGMINR